MTAQRRKRILRARQGPKAAPGVVGHTPAGESPATGRESALTGQGRGWLTVAAMARRLGLSAQTLARRAATDPELWAPGPALGPWQPGRYAPAKVAALEAFLSGALSREEALAAWGVARDRLRLAAKGLM